MCIDRPWAEFQIRYSLGEDCSGWNTLVDICPAKEIFVCICLSIKYQYEGKTISGIYLTFHLTKPEWQIYCK